MSTLPLILPPVLSYFNDRAFLISSISLVKPIYAKNLPFSGSDVVGIHITTL
jgi:hypothetical protein